jgi:hypothetical protein
MLITFRVVKESTLGPSSSAGGDEPSSSARSSSMNSLRLMWLSGGTSRLVVELTRLAATDCGDETVGCAE